MPEALIATGACSRDDPQPKLRPATMMSPVSTRSTNDALQILHAVHGKLVRVRCEQVPGGNDAVRPRDFRKQMLFPLCILSAPALQIPWIRDSPRWQSLRLQPVPRGNLFDPVTHPPDKIPVCRRQCHFALCEHARVTAEAGPHVGVEDTPPASTKIRAQPCLMHSRYTSCVPDHDEAHARRDFAPFSTLRHFHILDAPFVHEPITTWSTAMPFASPTGCVFFRSAGRRRSGRFRINRFQSSARIRARIRFNARTSLFMCGFAHGCASISRA